MTDQEKFSEEELTQNTLDQVRKLASTINAIIARAIRLQANGEEVDAGQTLNQMQRAYEQLLDLVPGKPEKQASEQKVFSPLDLIQQYWDYQAERRVMATSGFSYLDRALSGGFERDRLYVLLGGPGSGKTTLMNQIADHVAQERPVLYVTSEDTPMTLLSKTIARRAMIDYNAVLYGYPSERDRINAAFAEYRHQPQVSNIRYLDATQGIGLQEIATQAERHFKAQGETAKGDGLIIVDYLQRLVRAEEMLLRASGGALGSDARQAATVYTERLRVLACDLHCSVVCLSAMHRQSGYNNASSNLMSAAKESGDIEYTADVLLAIGEQQAEGGLNTLDASGLFAWCLTIAKNRQGLTSATGARIALIWQPVFQKFLEQEVSPAEGLDQGEPPAPIERKRYNRRQSK